MMTLERYRKTSIEFMGELAKWKEYPHSSVVSKTMQNTLTRVFKQGVVTEYDAELLKLVECILEMKWLQDFLGGRYSWYKRNTNRRTERYLRTYYGEFDFSTRFPEGVK